MTSNNYTIEIKLTGFGNQLKCFNKNLQNL